MNPELEFLVRHHGVLSRRQHPGLKRKIDSALRSGSLVAVLPGVYTAPADRKNQMLLQHAVAAWDPSAIVTGAAAAAATFWPHVAVPRIDVITQRRDAPSGFALHRWRVPCEHVIEREGVRVTSPALTSVMLSRTHGGSAIDEALRSRLVTIHDLREAFEAIPTRPGNQVRAALLADSKDSPWSAAERLAHCHLRSAGIGGWRANLAVFLDGGNYYLDIAFRRERLALEIDGFVHHSSREMFESDRVRQNQLMLAGWTVLRYTWATLEHHPEVFVREVSEWLGR